MLASTSTLTAYSPTESSLELHMLIMNYVPLVDYNSSDGRCWFVYDEHSRRIIRDAKRLDAMKAICLDAGHEWDERDALSQLVMVCALNKALNNFWGIEIDDFHQKGNLREYSRYNLHHFYGRDINFDECSKCSCHKHDYKKYKSSFPIHMPPDILA